MANDLILYSYWRSTAAYRVRIALNLLALECEIRPVHLVRDGGQQHKPDYVALNPQELVPTLVDGEHKFTQSMAIVEYLEERYGHATLLPDDPAARARVRGLAQIPGCDIHPIGNLRVLQYLTNTLEVADDARQTWSQHWIEIGFQALESLLADSPATGKFCHGDLPGLADICLVPQVYNAKRFGVDMRAYPTIQRIEATCNAEQAFHDARPEGQPDAPVS